MATLTQIEERLISGTGTIRVPSSSAKNRVLVLLCDIIRQPKNRYRNYNWSPDRGRYAALTFLRNGYVQKEDELVYARQQWVEIPDVTSQNLIALKCAYDGILQSFINLGNAIPFVFPTYTVDLIKDYEYLQYGWDSVNLRCYADTAVQVRLFSLQHDTCDPEKDDPAQPPPPPPPLPETPPGTGIADIDDPYDDDDDITDPHPIDDEAKIPPSPFPVGEACQRFTVIWTFKIRNNNTGAVTQRPNQTAILYAPIAGYRFTPVGTPQQTEWNCRGQFPQQDCQPGLIWRPIGAVSSFAGAEAIDFQLISITPYP